MKKSQIKTHKLLKFKRSRELVNVYTVKNCATSSEDDV